uniref:Phosphoglycerate mutase n=1 Tax=Pyramimonas orientalis virus TaxID=455367 RepID=A0A7M3UNS3_POV01|nr:hypothetical protein HWQ62_00217 [Pyramimonas orientalis virus]
MIYIIRHREGNADTNCLSKYGIERSIDIAKTFNTVERLNIHTCLPNATYYDSNSSMMTIFKHIRPLETASIVSSHMNKPLHLIENDDEFPSSRDGGHHLIVWHHKDIHNILQLYFYDAKFDWDDNDYDGCIVLDKYYWEFKPNYIKKNRFKQLCMNVARWIKHTI